MTILYKKMNKHTEEKEMNGVKYLQFPALNELGICRHLFSTRIGGVSKGDLASMNLSYTRGDVKENVDENFRRISKILDCEMSDFVLSHQTHTTNVRVVTEEDKGKGIISERNYQDVDGLITNVPGIVLSTFYADCVPLYFVDPIKKAIGLSHSGWRGTVNKMGRVTVEKMAKEYGCDPKDIVVVIGPSICVDCYEVSMDVANEFLKAFEKANNLSQIVVKKNNEKAMLDLWQANYAVMKEAGILKEHIIMPDVCTSCNKDILFSHRASNGKRGNLGAFLVLN